MKTAHLKYYRGIFTLVFVLLFTACAEVGGNTIDVHGPEIEFSLSSVQDLQRSEDAFSNYTLVAKSDTFTSIDIEAFFLEVGQTFSSVVEKAVLKNTRMTLSQDSVDFSGVESFLVKVRKLGRDELVPFCLIEQIIPSNTKQICFDNIIMESAEIFKLIESGFEAFLYARIQSPDIIPECLQDGLRFEFLSGTIIAVKVKTGALFNVEL